MRLSRHAGRPCARPHRALARRKRPEAQNKRFRAEDAVQEDKVKKNGGSSFELLPVLLGLRTSRRLLQNKIEFLLPRTRETEWLFLKIRRANLLAELIQRECRVSSPKIDHIVLPADCRYIQHNCCLKRLMLILIANPAYMSMMCLRIRQRRLRLSWTKRWYWLVIFHSRSYDDRLCCNVSARHTSLDMLRFWEHL